MRISGCLANVHCILFYEDPFRANCPVPTIDTSVANLCVVPLRNNLVFSIPIVRPAAVPVSIAISDYRSRSSDLVVAYATAAGERGRRNRTARLILPSLPLLDSIPHSPSQIPSCTTYNLALIPPLLTSLSMSLSPSRL